MKKLVKTMVKDHSNQASQSVWSHIDYQTQCQPKKTLYEGLRHSYTVGGQRLTTLKLIEKQLPKYMDIYGAIKLAQNKDAWGMFVNIMN